MGIETLAAYLGFIIFINSIYSLSFKRIYDSESSLRGFIFLRGLIIGSFIELCLLTNIYFLFKNNLWFLITLASITYSYSTVWHIYYLFKKDKEVLFAVSLIDIFASIVGIYLMFFLLFYMFS